MMITLKHGSTPSLAATWLACLLSFANWSVVAQEPDRPRLSVEQFRLTGDNLNEAERQQIYLNLIENFVGWTEANGRFVDSDEVEPGGGFFDAAGSGVNWQRGNGNLCLAYALLLNEYPEKQTFSIYQIPRRQLQDHLRRAMRSVCLSNRNASRHQPSDRNWGGPAWQSSLPMIGIAWTSIVGRDQLDRETLEWVKELVCRECDHLEKPIPTGTPGNTRAEDCTWNSPLLAFATNFYPDHPQAKRWDELSKKWALNAISIPGDVQSSQLVDGQPLSHWVVSENVFPDLTIVNHNMWSVGYQCTSQHFCEGALAYRMNGNAIPQAFSFRAQKMWQTVTRWLFLWDGDILFPHGQDWSWKTYSTIEYLCWQYCCRGNSDAGAYESRALQMIYRRQLKIGTGELGAAYSSRLNFGNQTVKPKRWAFCYLMHKHFPPPPATSLEAADKHAHGVRIFRHTQTAIHRNAHKCVSVSWHPDRQPIYIIPEGDSTFTKPPFFIPYDRASGTAIASFHSARTDQISADHETEKHPSRFLADDNPKTYWVGSHADSQPGDGPTESRPILIESEFEQPANCNALVLQSRLGYGPKAIEILAQTPSDKSLSLGTFDILDNEKNQVIRFPATTASSFRIRITDAYDSGSPANPRNVQVREIEFTYTDHVPRQDEDSKLAMESVQLLEATPTHQGQGMRVQYAKHLSATLEQRIMVWSLPGPLTVYATQFRSSRDGTAKTGSVFPYRVAPSPGFEMTGQPEFGSNWLNLQDHLGVVSARDIPKPNADGTLVLANERDWQVQANQPFGTTAFVFGCRVPGQTLQQIATSIQLPTVAGSNQVLSFDSPDGKTQLPINLFAENDFGRILQRYRQILLAAPRVMDDDEVDTWLSTTNADGSWADLDYEDDSRAGWQPYQHLLRMKSIADAIRRENSILFDNTAARRKVISQLRFWTEHRPQSLNWWYNRIGTPRLVRDTMVLLDDDLPPDLRQQSIEVLKQNRLSGTGANLLWTAETALHLGCLEADEEQVQRATNAIWDEIVVGKPEGIQPDWSFFQHGARMQTFSYGKFFLEIAVHTAWQMRDTKWAIPAAKQEIISNYLLEGMQWMSREIFTVPSTMDRQFSRPNRLDDADVRPQLELWQEVVPVRKAELQRFLNRQRGTEPPVAGFRHYRNADLSVYHRPAGSIFVKTISNRTKPTETTNRENLKGRRYLHSGDHYVLIDGTELEGIQPTLDWHRMPGVTLSALETTQDRRPFTGGLGNEESGLAAMDYARVHDADNQSETVRSRLDFEVNKSWFFHDDQMICLLGGWQMSNRDHSKLTTSIAQCLLDGDVVFADRTGRIRRLPVGEKLDDRFQWVLHNGVGYLLLGEEACELYAGPATGTWAAINDGYRDRTDPVTENVFRMYLEHGAAPQATGYVVVLGADEDKMVQLAQDRNWRVLSNDSRCQAISFDDQIMSACFAPTEITVSAQAVNPNQKWRLRVDSPCLLQIFERSLLASLPDQNGRTIQVGIDQESYEIKIPAGGKPMTLDRDSMIPKAHD